MVLGRQGSRSCGYFHAKKRGSRRTAKSDRTKAALPLAVVKGAGGDFEGCDPDHHQGAFGLKNADLDSSSVRLRSSWAARLARPVSVTVFKKIYAIRLAASSRTSARCKHSLFARFIRSVSKTSRIKSSPDLYMRSTRWSVALCAVCDPCGDSSLTALLGGAHQVGKNGPPEHRELECGSLGSAQARRRASSDRTTSRVGLGERAERRAGS